MTAKNVIAAEPVDETSRMMEIALSQGEAGVAALERLVAMRERAEARAAATNYADAVARFQDMCPVVGKNAEGAHRARYATFDHIMSSIRPALSATGLSVTFDSEDASDGRLRVWCVVRHSHGHSERTSFIVSKEKAGNRMNATQADGSAMQYGRRYALCLALGISTGEVDDDGAGAGSPDEPPITEEQVATLKALAEEVGADMPKFLKWAGVDALADIRVSRYDKAVKGLEAKR